MFWGFVKDLFAKGILKMVNCVLNHPSGGYWLNDEITQKYYCEIEILGVSCAL